MSISPSTRDVEGFTLIELLIVVVIIGILAAIAIPQFSSTKDTAYVAQVKSDLRNAVPEMETSFATNSTYDSASTSDFTSSENVTLTISSQSDTGYCLQGTHSNLSGRTWAVGSGGSEPTGAQPGEVVEASC